MRHLPKLLLVAGLGGGLVGLGWYFVLPAGVPERRGAPPPEGLDGIGDPAHPENGPISSPEAGLVFEPFPGSRQLCSQHAIGAESAPGVLWELYATDRSPNEVRSFYAGHAGEEAAPAPAEVQLRVGDNLLTAYPASSRAYPRCGVDPGASDQTVIVISVLIR